MNDFEVEFLDYREDIETKTIEFLRLYNKENKFPIPIEEIIDNILEMDIIPLPNLEKVFNTTGLLTSDLKHIYVDEWVYNNQETRYRFTLAHEVGHRILHPKIYKSLQY